MVVAVLRSRFLRVVVLGSFASACADPVQPEEDAGVVDSGAATDAGMPRDTGVPPPDSGVTRDAGTSDAAPRDDGTSDAAPPDAGESRLELPTGVLPLLPGVDRWNDYVANDGPSVFESTGQPCDVAVQGGYTACLHVGEMRAVEVLGVADCAGLSASDSLGAFDWRCDDTSGSVTMVSTGLADARFVSHLIDLDAAPPTWRPNSVTVTNGAATSSTSATVWWPNPIEMDNDGGSLATAGTIYVATSTPTAPYSIDADRVGFVVRSGVNARLTSAGHSFLWIEGEMEAGGDAQAVALDTTSFSVLRNVHASGATLQGVLLNDSSNNMLSYVSATGNGTDGIALTVGRWNTLWRANASGNSRHGFEIRSRHTTVMEAVAADNGFHGFNIAFAPFSRFALLLATNNERAGIALRSASRCTFVGVTSANNGFYGLWSVQTLSLTTHALALINNPTAARIGDTTVSLGSHFHTFFDLVVAHGRTGMFLENSNNNYFSGRLARGGNMTDCRVSGSTPGLEDDCSNQGPSTATAVTGVDAAASYVGAVTADDLRNGSDADGFGSVIASRDWVTFDNPHRVWIPDSVTPFPDTTLHGRCAGGCRIFDFGLAIGDPVFLDVLPVPSGDDTLDHVWSSGGQASCGGVPFAVADLDTCSLPGYLDEATCVAAGASWTGNCGTRFLRNAVELMADEIGNDNTLCESGESCLWMPSIGEYQGHGDLTPAPAFVDGQVTGVRLFQFTSSGR